MGKALEMIGVFATAPSTGAAGAACTGNSLTIRKTEKPVKLLAITALQQATAGARVITSPFLHDTTNGIRIQQAVSQVNSSANRSPQVLKSQDTLTVTIVGSAVAGDIEHTALHVWYDDLPGVDGNFIGIPELDARLEEIYSVPLTLTAVATGQYATGVALNSSVDQFRANQDYAIIGAMFSGTLNASMAIRIVGPDLGNIGCGIPILQYDQDIQANWFPEIAHQTKTPCIPVVNAANKAITTVAQVGNENAASVTATLIMGLLGQARMGGRGR